MTEYKLQADNRQDNIFKQINEIRKLIGNNDPKEFFYEMCKQRGVDPEEILKQLR